MTPAIEAALKRAADRIDQPDLSGKPFTPGSVNAKRIYIVLEELGLVPAQKKALTSFLQWGPGTPIPSELWDDARACGLLPDSNQVRGVSFDGTERRLEPNLLTNVVCPECNQNLYQFVASARPSDAVISEAFAPFAGVPPLRVGTLLDVQVNRCPFCRAPFVNNRTQFWTNRGWYPAASQKPELLHHKQFTKSITLTNMELTAEELLHLRDIAESVPGCRLVVTREETP